MSRVQLALNVSDIDAAVDFYSKLFGAEPAKRRPGYANFAIAEPPLKLVLIENAAGRGDGVAGALNHLGRGGRVARGGPGGHPAALGRGARARRPGVDDLLLRRPGQGVGQRSRRGPWEVYTVLADAPEETGSGMLDRGLRAGRGAAGDRSAHGWPSASSACC